MAPIDPIDIYGDTSPPTPWQLIVVRLIAIFAVLSHGGALIGVVTAFALAPLQLPTWYVLVAALAVVSALVAVWTARATFTRPSSFPLGFRVLLGLFVIAMLRPPPGFDSAPRVPQWLFLFVCAFQAAITYSMPLGLLFNLRRRGRLR